MKLAARNSLLLHFLTLCCSVGILQASGLDWPNSWVNYGGAPRTLECKDDTRRTWWQRNTETHGELTNITTLRAEEWVSLSRCEGRRYCDVSADPTTTSLEYCCTSGSNPADDPPRDCYTISVCPLITRATVIPSNLLAGHQASLHLDLVSYPLPSSSPIIDNRISSTNQHRIEFRRSHDTQFLNASVAYTFTVPAEGEVVIDLDGLRADDFCGANVINGVAQMFEHPLPISGEPLAPRTGDECSECVCPSLLPPTPSLLPPTTQSSTSLATPQSTSTSSSSSSTISPSPSSSPLLPPPSSKTPRSTSTPTLSALSSPTNCHEQERLIKVLVGTLSVLFVTAVVAAVLAVCWGCRLRRKLRQLLSPNGEKGSQNGELKSALPDGFPSPLTPPSPPPPLPSSTPPPRRTSSSPPRTSTSPPPPSTQHEQQTSSESSMDSGIAKAPSDNELYSIPFQSSPPRSVCNSPEVVAEHQVSHHTAAGHSPGHIVSTASSTIELDDRGASVRVLHQHEGTEPYAFINGQLYLRAEMVNLDDSRNIGSPSAV